MRSPLLSLQHQELPTSRSWGRQRNGGSEKQDVRPKHTEPGEHPWEPLRVHCYCWRAQTAQHGADGNGKPGALSCSTVSLYFRKPKEPRKLILPIHFLELGRPQHCHLMTNRKLTRFFLCSLFFLLTAQNQAQTLHLNNQLYSSQPHFPHSGVTHDQWLKWKLDIFLRLPELRSRGTSMEPGFKEKQKRTGNK